MMNTSEQINELAAALSKAQGEIDGAVKDTVNGFFKNKYADLSSVWAACRKQLSANGISIIQSPEESESGIAVETMMMHSSGQWARGRYSMPVSKLDAQAVGSAITYARRYALAAMVGVAPEDDDGNAAAKTAAKKSDPSDVPTEAKKILTSTMVIPWEHAKAAYIRDGNLLAVKSRYTISEQHERKLISECADIEVNKIMEDIPQ